MLTDATVASGDAVNVVAGLEEESAVPFTGAGGLSI